MPWSPAWAVAAMPWASSTPTSPRNTRLIGVEAAGEGLDTDKHAASLQKGTRRVLHGNRTLILQDQDGQITETHSISAGLRLPRCRPRARLAARAGPRPVRGLHRQRSAGRLPPPVPHQGIIPALESSHAVAYAIQLAQRCAPSIHPGQSLGPRDKDIGTVADLSGEDFYDRPSMRGLKVKGSDKLCRQPPHHCNI